MARIVGRPVLTTTGIVGVYDAESRLSLIMKSITDKDTVVQFEVQEGQKQATVKIHRVASEYVAKIPSGCIFITGIYSFVNIFSQNRAMDVVGYINPDTGEGKLFERP